MRHIAANGARRTAAAGSKTTRAEKEAGPIVKSVPIRNADAENNVEVQSNERIEVMSMIQPGAARQTVNIVRPSVTMQSVSLIQPTATVQAVNIVPPSATMQAPTMIQTTEMTPLQASSVIQPIVQPIAQPLATMQAANVIYLNDAESLVVPVNVHFGAAFEEEGASDDEDWMQRLVDEFFRAPVNVQQVGPVFNVAEMIPAAIYESPRSTVARVSGRRMFPEETFAPIHYHTDDEHYIETPAMVSSERTVSTDGKEQEARSGRRRNVFRRCFNRIKQCFAPKH